MEFDETTLWPTYRLLAAVPSRSQAFAIAERLGLDPAVIARARAQRTVGEGRFLDAASLNGLAEVEILHGKGTGWLQEAVGEFLRSDPRVASFALAPLEQGGAGVTKVKVAL